MIRSFLVLGNDKRQLYLRDRLISAGQNVSYIEADAPAEVSQYDVILLPMPDSRKYYNMIESGLHTGQYVFGCNMNIDVGIDGVRYIEYMKYPGTAYKNAVAAAEGAIAEAVRLSAYNLQGSRCLVTGFGKCGEILSGKLQALKGIVTVTDMDCEKVANARAYGYDGKEPEYVNSAGEELGRYLYIFNTVPAMVFTSDVLRYVSKESVIVDIASRPGGVDMEYCECNGINAIHVLGIPGKYSPASSADILMEVITACLDGGCNNAK